MRYASRRVHSIRPFPGLGRQRANFQVTRGSAGSPPTSITRTGIEIRSPSDRAVHVTVAPATAFRWVGRVRHRGGGFGLVGLKERVTALGGELDAGRRAGHG